MILHGPKHDISHRIGTERMITNSLIPFRSRFDIFWGRLRHAPAKAWWAVCNTYFQYFFAVLLVYMVTTGSLFLRVSWWKNNKRVDSPLLFVWSFYTYLQLVAYLAFTLHRHFSTDSSAHPLLSVLISWRGETQIPFFSDCTSDLCARDC